LFHLDPSKQMTVDVVEIHATVPAVAWGGSVLELPTLP
jgi:hypothetical protein